MSGYQPPKGYFACRETNAQATWKRLLPFFQLPGTITLGATMVRSIGTWSSCADE
ncbi:hypothetical protein KDH_48250 [Dictyobacter sp. S3.2.2.5]|uniref:Uncharacterized protein n=1 Tax=Dictyobacter halimunensis TaxID=3026934 RepID=A0ABQ6FYS1_9CHLR|nr:hypothetical protein KDH_48250 [Dictyobacter sp. S3.2.2.5]